METRDRLKNRRGKRGRGWEKLAKDLRPINAFPMETDYRVVKAWCRVGTGWRRTMEERKGDSCNTLNNKHEIFKRLFSSPFNI